MKFRLICVLTVMTIFGLASPAFASEAQEGASDGSDQSASSGESRKMLDLKDEYTGRNRLGVVAGLSSGVGISYAHYITDNFAIRGAGYVLHVKDTASLYSFGMLAQFDIHRVNRFQLYAVAGLGFGHAEWPDLIDEPLELGLFPGAGVGLELGYHFERSVTYQIELVLTGMYVDGKFTKLLPLPQLGIHFNF